MNALSIGILVVAIIICLLYTYAVGVLSHYRFVYSRNRWKKSDIELTGGELARSTLDKYGLVDVEVKKSFFNSYNKRKRTVYLAWRVYSKNNLSAHAIVMQLCTLATMHAAEDKHMPKFEQISSLGFVSAVFIFGALITGIAYALGAANMGIATLAVLIIAFILYLTSFIMSIVNLKNQKYVNQKVEILMNDLAVFTEEDQKRIKKINKAYMQYRMVESLLTFFYTLYFFLKIIGAILKGIGKK